MTLRHSNAFSETGFCDKFCAMTDRYIHPTADIQTDNIGSGTKIWQFCVALAEAQIGEDCNICSHVYIENSVSIGNRVTIKNHAVLFDGVSLEDNVFVGPNVTFTNDKTPHSLRGANREFTPTPTVVRTGAAIGAGAVILPGLEIGADALIGAGAVVTKNVAAGTTVIGNPARPL